MVLRWQPPYVCLFFFFNDTATTEIYTLSLHDALPISAVAQRSEGRCRRGDTVNETVGPGPVEARERLDERRREGRCRESGDRKSTRLNSSHGYISYAVFCLKKKKTEESRHHTIDCLAI